MIPLIMTKKFVESYTKNDLKKKLLKLLMFDTEKFFTKEELIEKICGGKDLSQCSERLRESYETNLRKLIQRTRFLLMAQQTQEDKIIEWFLHEKDKNGWKLYKTK